MLEILFGRLSLPLYNQALKKISKFVKTNILPGAIAEVGLLCCACVHSNPEEAVTQLVEPILLSVISSLEGTPATGFGGRGMCDASVSTKVKPTISPALETAIDHQLKVNGAGDHLLRSLLGSLILYYPIDQYKCILHHPNAAALEEWISTKDYSGDKPMVAPKWHIPSVEEVEFANELLDLHFQLALDDLSRICETKVHSDPGAFLEGDDAVAVAEEVKKNNHVVRKLEKRQQICTLDQHIEEQFGGGRLLACIIAWVRSSA
ncbi:unnamed protein product [Prunus armeniaca]|uniref:Proteasome activator Blm10 middle HEAT repeats region domain-containing protein n=1 Tax=Prunus armeniaca TaxID=36596 RepID=A0A6J5VJG8_PRUAR|nr:unnamed protein product [Prunus armeniaca]